jgi:hypothetical protein
MHKYKQQFSGDETRLSDSSSTPWNDDDDGTEPSSDSTHSRILVIRSSFRQVLSSFAISSSGSNEFTRPLARATLTDTIQNVVL